MLCCAVQVEALRRADPLSKESNFQKLNSESEQAVMAYLEFDDDDDDVDYTQNFSLFLSGK
jgi:hypothetical protein